jgi:hypothetical protein
LVGVGVCVGVFVGEPLGVLELVGVPVPVPLLEGVPELLGVTEEVGVPVPVPLLEGVPELLGVSEAVGLTDAVGVTLGVGLSEAAPIIQSPYGAHPPAVSHVIWKSSAKFNEYTYPTSHLHMASEASSAKIQDPCAKLGMKFLQTVQIPAVGYRPA